MRRLVAFILRHGTAISWALVALAWTPLLLLSTFGADTWAVFGWCLLLALLGVAGNVGGALLAALTAIRVRRKRWALLACFANLASLLLLRTMLS
jgi:hypothetical protein